jgi:hypothetical protein
LDDFTDPADVYREYPHIMNLMIVEACSDEKILYYFSSFCTKILLIYYFKFYLFSSAGFSNKNGKRNLEDNVMNFMIYIYF